MNPLIWCMLLLIAVGLVVLVTVLRRRSVSRRMVSADTQPSHIPSTLHFMYGLWDDGDMPAQIGRAHV